MRRMNLIKNTVTLLVLVLLIAGCSGSKATPTEDVDQIGNFTPIVSATGIVVPEQWSRISVSSPGKIEEVLVERGDQVKKSQVLVRLEGGEDLLAAITAADLAVISAQQALDDLYENVAISKANSLRAVNDASNAMRDAKYDLDNFIVPTVMKGLTALEAVDVMRGKLDQARDAFEPYKFDSEFSDHREELKDKLDTAQSNFDSAVKWLTYEFALDEAESRLQKALKDYDILTRGPDPEDVALAEARLENAKATLAAAQEKLDDLEIKASFPGTVSELNVRAGEFVSPELPILVVADLGHLRVDTTDLNEIDVARVKTGDTVKVTFDALPDVVVTGTIRLISPKSSEGSGVNYTVIVDLAEIPANLRWGMTAFVDIEVNN